MVKVGFHRKGYLFTIDSPITEARALACSVIDSIDKKPNFADKQLLNYIREFYCFEMRNVSNLLVPGEGRAALQNERVNIRTLLSREETDTLLRVFYDDDCADKGVEDPS